MKKKASGSPKTPVSAPSKPTPAASKPVPASVGTSEPAKKNSPAKVKVPKVSGAVASASSKPMPVGSTVVPAVKAPVPEGAAVTTIIAQVDVGFGNGIYIRGEGAGLNWDKGILMENVAADRWQIILRGVTTPVVFKFLLNDETWSVGEDYVITPGSSLALVPLF